MSENRYIVITVSSSARRDNLVKELMRRLLADNVNNLLIENDRVDRIKVYHRINSEVKVLVRIYLIVIIPTSINLAPLRGLGGKVEYRLDNTINELKDTITILSQMNGKQVDNPTSDKDFESTLRSLSTT